MTSFYDLVLRPYAVSLQWYFPRFVCFLVWRPCCSSWMFVTKRAEQFVELWKQHRVSEEDILVSFEVESLLINVVVEETLQIIHYGLVLLGFPEYLFKTHSIISKTSRSRNLRQWRYPETNSSSISSVVSYNLGVF